MKPNDTKNLAWFDVFDGHMGVKPNDAARG